MTNLTIKHYNNFITSVENLTENGNRVRYHAGDNFIIDVTKCEADLSSSHSLMNLWKKAGYITETMPTYICIDTYFTDCNGSCWGYYNVTHTKNGKINFAYLREWNAENINELVAECIRLREMDIA